MEKSNQIVEIYNLARVRGLCHRQKDFAGLLSMSESTLSQAMAGVDRALTPNLVKRVKTWARQMGLIDDEGSPIGGGGSQGGKPQGGVFIPQETAELYTSMAKSIENLTAIVSRLTEK